MTTRTAVLLSAVVLTVGACVQIPDESVALARLAEAEILAVELVEEALGPGHVTSWERTLYVEGCPSLCREGNCHATDSIMYLEGDFDLEEVMEALAQSAEPAGGTVRDVQQVGRGFSRTILLTGTGRFQHRMGTFWEDGVVEVVVDTGEPSCYRVQE